jgi:hypothetical protein
MNKTNGQTCATKIEEYLYFGTERVIHFRKDGALNQEYRAFNFIELSCLFYMTGHTHVD